MRKRNRNRNKGLMPVLFAAALAAGITACQGPSKTDAPGKSGDKTEQTETVPETEAEEAWGEEDQNALFSYYQEMDIDWVRNIQSSIDRYYKYTELQEEFSLKGKDYDISHISEYDLKNAKRVYEMLQEKEDQDELDHAFLEVYPSMTNLMQVINKIEEYADLKSYVDDDFAKAKEYHKELWDTYQQYTQYIDAFRSIYDRESRERLDRVQKEAQESGQTARYEATCALKAAKALSDEMKAQGLKDKNILDMNLDTMQPLYEEFLQHVNAVMEEPAEDSALSESGVMNGYLWEDYVDAVKDTKTSMTLLLQTVKDKKTTSSSSIAGNNSIVSYEVGLRDMMRYYDRMLYQQN